MPNRTMFRPALAGIIEPTAFAITFTILGLVRDGYSLKAEQISDLGATGTDLAILQDINFIIAGLLILVLAIGMFRLSEFGKRAKTGSGFVALIGLGLVASGIFSADPRDLQESTSAGGLHDLFGIITFLSAFTAMFVMSRSLPRYKYWQTLRVPSLVWGVVTFALLALFIASDPVENTSELVSWTGAIQWAFAGAFLLWIVVMALALFRRADTESAILP
ncbi:MAG: DUF998 domain-containing protein [Gammaproteobacteria bacterium]|nr:DUF998 domain-containing protein [Gammaproteobacteria bacterium]